jgi:prephenate dehydrogenase
LTKSPGARAARSRHVIKNVAIIGMGLIGASIGLALHARAKRRRIRITGFDTRRAHANIARRRGAIDRVATSLRAAVADADVVVLAVPLRSVVALLPAVMRAAAPGALVIDVAGQKLPVAAAAMPLLARQPSATFIGGHPMAGAEFAGPDRAAADLFRGRPFALCSLPQPGGAETVRRADRFVRALGAVPVHVDAALHDRIVAATSALPQLVASAVALAAADLLDDAKGLIGPGFDSVTRLAQSPPDLWTGPILTGRRNIVRVLTVFEERLRSVRQAIERGDAPRMRRLLRSAGAAQRRLKSS